jgi:hypothetical protein
MTPQLRTLIYVSEKKRLLLNLATGAEEPALDKHLQYQNLLGSGPLYVDTVGFTGSILKLPAWERYFVWLRTDYSSPSNAQPTLRTSHGCCSTTLNLRSA